ncbi:MAG: DNA alkylation repair protein [Acidobacteriota bacterium]
MTHTTHSPSRTAAAARLALKNLARPVGSFDASRYFRGTVDLRFLNVGTVAVRALARSIHAEHAAVWTIDDAVLFADTLIVDQYLEVKGVGIELLARYRRDFTPRLLTTWKRWLASGHAANWATTDAICGSLIGPVLVAHPGLAPTMREWARHRSLWVRRASAVSLIPSLRKGAALDLAYHIASALSDDQEDLIQKAVGWTLREAGKADPARLDRYLRQHGPAIPRTTVRYAIERFPRMKRLELLRATRT